MGVNGAIGVQCKVESMANKVRHVVKVGWIKIIQIIHVRVCVLSDGIIQYHIRSVVEDIRYGIVEDIRYGIGCHVGCAWILPCSGYHTCCNYLGKARRIKVRINKGEPRVSLVEIRRGPDSIRGEVHNG